MENYEIETEKWKNVCDINIQNTQLIQIILIFLVFWVIIRTSSRTAHFNAELSNFVEYVELAETKKQKIDDCSNECVKWTSSRFTYPIKCSRFDLFLDRNLWLHGIFWNNLLFGNNLYFWITSNTKLYVSLISFI